MVRRSQAFLQYLRYQTAVDVSSLYGHIHRTSRTDALRGGYFGTRIGTGYATDIAAAFTCGDCPGPPAGRYYSWRARTGGAAFGTRAGRKTWRLQNAGARGARPASTGGAGPHCSAAWCLRLLPLRSRG